MPDEVVTSEPTETTPDLTTELAEMVGSGAPGGLPESDEASATPLEASAEAPPAAPPPPSAMDEFDIDGRTVNKDALFQTYRQFTHLQQRHQEIKPFLEFMQEAGLTAAHIPQFRAWVQGQLERAAAPAAQPGSTARPIEEQPWFQEIAETFPEFAKYIKTEVSSGMSAREELNAIKQSLSGYTEALHSQRQQEAAFSVLNKAATVVNDLMPDFPRLQDPQVRGAFLRWVWDTKQAGPRIADSDYMRGMYMVFDHAALAEQWAAQAKASHAAHAATVTRGFAETGAPRLASRGTEDVLTKELHEMMST